VFTGSWRTIPGKNKKKTQNKPKTVMNLLKGKKSLAKFSLWLQTYLRLASGSPGSSQMTALTRTNPSEKHE